MGEMHNAIGQPSPSAGVAGMHKNIFGAEASQSVPNLEDEMSIDKSTLETMKALYSAKERAVANEDFDEAKRLKETIERLKMVSG
jgi:excinuclease UvrABC nuclease subunit